MEKTDRIAIVGGGPAGIHMAYLLHNEGYQHIDLYEKEREIGGRVRTFRGKDALHELGACWTAPNYHSVHELMHRFGMKMPHMAGATGRRTVVQDKGSHGAMLSSMLRYMWNHHKFFGKYVESGQIDWKATRKKIRDLWSMPFEAYLEKFDLLSLKSAFLLMLTAQGYGFLDSIPTYYGLRWITPSLLASYRFYLLEGFLSLIPKTMQTEISKLIDHLFTTIHPTISAVPLIVPQGFQTLFLRMEKFLLRCRGGVGLYKSVKVNDIQRDFHKIAITTSRGKAEYQHLFLAIPWKNIKAIVKRPTSWESNMIRSTQTYTIMTALIQAKTTAQSYTSAVVSWPSNLETGGLYSLRNSKAALNRASVSIHSKKTQEFVAYQLLDHPIDASKVKMLKKRLIRDLRKLAFLRNIRIWKYNVYPEHNPHLPGKQLKLMAERDENQGNQNTYYIGAGASFDSVLHVIDYNTHLLQLIQQSS